MPQKTKSVALEKFLEKTTLKPNHFWAGEALNARTRDCQHYIDSKWNSVIFQISAEKVSWLEKRNFLHLLNESRGEWIKVYKNVQDFFCHAEKLFSEKIWRMTEFHFWANVMLRQPRVPAFKAFPAQNVWGLRMFFSKNFSRATFFCFQGQLVGG